MDKKQKKMNLDEFIKKYGIKSERILYEDDEIIGKLLILNKNSETTGIIREEKKEKKRKKKGEKRNENINN